MIFRQRFLDGIRRGTITVAFRRWRRPSVRTGGTLLTAVGQLDIASVSPVTLDEISDADASRAGYASRESLVAELDARAEGEVYRIDLGELRPDPRHALRDAVPLTALERDSILDTLRKLDARSDAGPWTGRVLRLIRTHPATRAADLSRQIGQETPQFKLNVRKLKALGLTESLEVGYRLSPRGAAVAQWLDEQPADASKNRW